MANEITKSELDKLAPGALHIIEQAQELGYLPKDDSSFEFYEDGGTVFFYHNGNEFAWDGSSWEQL